MSTCSTAACGLGGFGGPAPGDPSNDSVLSATPAFGGIDITWSLPTTRPFAVSYTKLFRGLTADFATAIQIAEPSGGFYYDKLDSATRHYYWIQHVSVNGTLGAVIGPATAIARPVIAKVIEDLTAQIDAGLLAQSLKGRIDAIALLQNDLLKEVRDRENGDTTWAQALADVQNGVAQAHTFIANERSTRISENSALVQQIQGVATTSGNALSAAMTTLRSEATADRQAMTTRIDTVNSQLGTQISSVQTQSTTSINSLTGTVNALWTAKVDVNGLIGGFGLSNNGQQVEAGFDVDRFWIGRTTNKRKPFIIDNGVVYIDEAAINKLTFSKLRDESGSFLVAGGKIKANYLEVTGIFQSDNYAAGSAGFMLRRSDGFAEFGNIRARGDIQATSLTANTVTVDNLVAGSTGRETFYKNENSLSVVPSTWHALAQLTITPRSGRPVHGVVSFAARQTGGRNGAEHRIRVCRYVNYVSLPEYVWGGSAGAPLTTGYDGTSMSLSFVDTAPVGETPCTYSVELQLIYADDRATVASRFMALRELNKAHTEIVEVPYTPPSGGGGGGGGWGGGGEIPP